MKIPNSFNRTRTLTLLIAILAPLFTGIALASGAVSAQALDLTAHPIGYLSLLIFVVAYGLVMAEEFTHLRKSKPVILAAGIMWLLVAVAYKQAGDPHTIEQYISHNLIEYVELFLFLLAAMTYINAMDERQVFDALRSWLIRKGFGYRSLFWVTGILAFFISPLADNLTTALLMCAVIMAVGADNPRFVGIGCINVVVAANAGGAFSPFGDITTLMVWQEGIQTPQGEVDFWSFFLLFIPSVVNFLIPASIMQMAVPNVKPQASDEVIPMKRGAKRIMLLFLATIITAVSFHNFFHLPPMLGMMTGLAYLQFFGYYLKKTHRPPLDMKDANQDKGIAGDFVPFDVFNKIARAEWDTLLFFYGVIMCVGALSIIGYLAMASQFMYVEMGPTFANVMVGILSAIIDNIPVMFAVLTMEPEMSQGQWLLATLTAGVGGSMLSIGSAAGVALMGQARGMYTFFGHLKWTWAIALGYVASIYVHMYINASLF